MLITRVASTMAGVALAVGASVPPAQAAEAPPEAEPMIIGGVEAKNTHGAVRLYRDGDPKCTASIIAPKWVLTAKHCVRHVDNDDADEELSFKVGDVDLDDAEEVRAKEGGLHLHDDADLALVELGDSVETDDYAHLGTRALVGGLTNQAAYIYGWGATCKSPLVPETMCQSSVLKKAGVTVRDTNCEDGYGGRALCARRGDGVAAGGDSGGPLFVAGINGEPYQVGVGSKSNRSRSMEYTNVLEYEDWIEDVMDD